MSATTAPESRRIARPPSGLFPVACFYFGFFCAQSATIQLALSDDDVLLGVAVWALGPAAWGLVMSNLCRNSAVLLLVLMTTTLLPNALSVHTECAVLRDRMLVTVVPMYDPVNSVFARVFVVWLWAVVVAFVTPLCCVGLLGISWWECRDRPRRPTSQGESGGASVFTPKG